MNFPSDMTFRYFLFDTYPGCFLQVLPIALLAGAVYFLIQAIRHSSAPRWQKWFSCLFICYFVGLISLVCLFQGISYLWNCILYPGSEIPVLKNYTLTSGVILTPNFISHMSAEKLANILMFMPFGFFYPFIKRNVTWKKTLLTGLVLSTIIEVIQPLFNRCFDINDIIMNTLGVFVGASLAYLFFDFVED